MPDMLESLNKLISFRSVYTKQEAPYPYGEQTNKAMHYVLELCESFGFRVHNADEKYAYAEIGQGEELVGILVHLDVVPEGKGWTYPPFELTEKDGILYGRGVSDDKGPAISVIYAMKDLLDSKVPINKRIRIIFGQSEEVGDWKDIELYKKMEELPAYGFTPDADFPLIRGEKGIYHAQISFFDTTGFVSLEGGQAVNIVPNEAKCIIKTKDNKETELFAEGKAAHGSRPQLGINAISLLMEKAAACNEELPFAVFYRKLFGEMIYGEGIGCALSDEESGPLTLNIGTVKKENDRICMTLDIRTPVTVDQRIVTERIEEALKPYPVELNVFEAKPAVYFPKEHYLVDLFLDAYRTETGDPSEATILGGTTYAKAMPNIMAFGPLFPNRTGSEHEADEHAYKEDLLRSRKIYRHTLEEILKR